MKHSYKSALFYLSALLFIGRSCSCGNKKNSHQSNINNTDEVAKKLEKKKKELQDINQELEKLIVENQVIEKKIRDLDDNKEENKQKEKEDFAKEQAEKATKIEELQSQVKRLNQEKEDLAKEQAEEIKKLGDEKKALNEVIEKMTKERCASKQDEFKKLYDQKIKGKNIDNEFVIKEICSLLRFRDKKKEEKVLKANNQVIQKKLKKLLKKDLGTELIKSTVNNLNDMNLSLRNWVLGLPYHELEKVTNWLIAKEGLETIYTFINRCISLHDSLCESPEYINSSSWKNLREIVCKSINMQLLFLIDGIENIINKSYKKNKVFNRELSANKKIVKEALSIRKDEFIVKYNNWKT